jgi:hypothetical protein
MHAVFSRTHFGAISMCMVLAALAPASAPAQAATAPDSAQVLASALHWLALVDSGRYPESLDSAAPPLRRMTGTTDAWREFVSQARAAFRPIPSRALVGLDPAPDVTGAPAGRYLRITFRVGANDPVVYEVVVLQETPTGSRVAMYGTTPLPPLSPRKPSAAGTVSNLNRFSVSP